MGPVIDLLGAWLCDLFPFALVLDQCGSSGGERTLYFPHFNGRFNDHKIYGSVDLRQMASIPGICKDSSKQLLLMEFLARLRNIVFEKHLYHRVLVACDELLYQFRICCANVYNQATAEAGFADQFLRSRDSGCLQEKDG